MSLDANDIVSLALLLLGGAASVAGLWFVSQALWRRPAEAAPGVESERPTVPVSRRALIGALVLAGASVALGLSGIERRGMTHVEVFVPGIDLPEALSVPPPRTELIPTIMWHLTREPHPPGYFVAMWGWTSVFGTSLTALRLPSVLFGGMAVLLIFGLGTRVGRSPVVGLTAAALLAFNGHHVYWTQHARMYELALLLALASTWAWVEIISGGKRRPRVEVAYVAATVLGLYCHTLMWPVLALQWLFTLTRRPGPTSLTSRPLVLHTLSVIVGAPMLAHALYVGQDIGSGGSALISFVQDFVDFGFLFTPDTWSIPVRDLPWLPELLFSSVAVLCLITFAATSEYRDSPPAQRETTDRPRGLTALALGVALVLYAVSREAYQRQVLIGLVGVIPLLAVAHLALLDRLTGLRRHLHPDRPDSWIWNPMVAVGLGSFGLVFLIALIKPVMVSRALLVSVPALLVMLAGGLVALTRRARVLGVVAILITASAHLWSVSYFHAFPGPNDYRGATEQLLARLEPEDPVFVVRHWSQTPLFYHMPDDFDRLVGADYAAVTGDPARNRIWVARISDAPIDSDILDALGGFEPTDSVSALRTRFLLFERR
jgi:4-amino-4-deoxy-L-arabinose transferase-like glycosyltransferase